MEKINEKIKLKSEELAKIYDSKDCMVNQEVLEESGLKNVVLRPYQLEGIKWLMGRFMANVGCILADEMGLGKTCQAIGFLTLLYGKKGLNKPSLILLPLSLVHNWKNELNKFSPNLKYLMYTGSKEERGELRRSQRFCSKELDLLVTTYETCIKDQSYLMSYHWSVVIVDEAHRLKNSQSNLHAALTEFNVDQWVLLTGTPIQNNLKELYSLLSLSCPSMFRPEHLGSFLSRYKDIAFDDDGGRDIKLVVENFILRRVKSQVVLDLPSRSEVILYHGVSSLQSKFYRSILAKDYDALQSGRSQKKVRLMNILVQLRKCICHPYLFDGVEPEPFVVGEHLVEASGKLHLLDGLLRHMKSTGHKVLIFSQFTSHLDIIQDYMSYRKYSYERLDGSVRSEERNVAVNNFNDNEATFAFLLSTRAGGQGLNLTSADTVIFLDSDFNPQNDLQAAARAHRIGQKRNVKVIRLVGRYTVEEMIMKMADKKLHLTKVVMASSSSAGDGGELKLEDVIKFGLDRLFNEDQCFQVDFEAILGKSVNGEWMEDARTPTNEIASRSDSTTADRGVIDIGADRPDGSPNDGANVDGFEPSARDEEAFKEICLDEMSKKASASSSVGVCSTRRNKTTTLFEFLKDKERKPRGPLTAEQLEERRRKRKEREARLAAEEEDKKRWRDKEKLERRLKLWEQNNYSPSKLESSDDDDDGGDVNADSDDDDTSSWNPDDDKENKVISAERSSRSRSTDDDDDVNRTKKRGKHADDDDNDEDYRIDDASDDNDKESASGFAESVRSTNDDDDNDDVVDDEAMSYLHYVVGDVTKPVSDEFAAQDSIALIVHCVDNSGQWGRGGLFTSISSRSLLPSEKYELAGKMRDLSPGGVHIFPLGEENRKEGRTVKVALLVVQRRDRNNRPTDVDVDELRSAFKKLLKFSSSQKLSLHFPRIGRDRPSFDWYGAERMIRKYFSSRKIHAYIYYFPRRQAPSGGMKIDEGESSASPGPSRSTSSLEDKISPRLPNFLKDVSIHFARTTEDSVERVKTLTRYVIAYGGTIHDPVRPSTTHVVAVDDTDVAEVPSSSARRFVDISWLVDSIKKQRVMHEDSYFV